MDLSKLKWVVIILVVVGGGWLLTSGGINWVYNQATDAVPGVDPAKDKTDEAMLSKYGGFLLTTFRYEGAKKFYRTAVERYPEGANAWWNYYQLARCEEKLGNYKEACDILFMLWEQNADQYDERVPDMATLRLRLDKLIEIHELPHHWYPGGSTG
jgi:tetratricopeptide (TPR) repeat protein